MNRKILCTVLALLLCISMALSVSAEPKAVSFIIDELGYLTDEELDALNEQARDIYEQTGVGIFFLYTGAGSVSDYGLEPVLSGITDYVVMVENETHWDLHLGGLGETIASDGEDALRAVYDETPTYSEGVAAFLTAAAEYFPVKAPVLIAPNPGERFVYDNAGLLTGEEAAALNETLGTVSHTQQAQILIVTVASLEGGDIDAYVDEAYDTSGFGYGDRKDGVLLLVCMDPREYRILSNGYAGVAIDTDVIADIGDRIVSDLSSGNYADAFQAFAEECAYWLDGYRNGFPFDAGKSLAIALIIGIAAGAITAFVLKGQLKTVRKQERANVYIRSDSMKITAESDIFLYRDLTRTKKESDSSSSSGGSARSKGGGSF